MTETTLEQMTPSPRSKRLRVATIILRNPSLASILLEGEDPIDAGNADELVAALRSRTIRRIVVLVDSSLIFPMNIPHPNGRGLPDGRRLAFLVEEALPFSAEEITVAARPTHGELLTASIRTEAARPWITALEDAGIEPVSIVPLGVALLQEISPDIESEQPIGLIVETEQSWEVGLIHDGDIVSWSTVALADDALPMKLLIALRGAEPLLRITLVQRDHDLSAVLTELAAEVNVTESTPPASVNRAIGERYLTSKVQPWIDLRGGDLGPRDPWRRLLVPISATMAGVLTLLLMLGFACWQRHSSYEEMRSDLENQQAALFRSLFPGQPIPVGIEARLRSEAARLQQAHSLAADREGDESAFTILHHALQTLPKDLRFRVVELTVDRGRLVMEGEARGHSDVELIAQQLTKSGDFESALPRTRKGSDRSVAFTITAELAIATASKGVRR